jgi:hypothetical protein
LEQRSDESEEFEQEKIVRDNAVTKANLKGFFS